MKMKLKDYMNEVTIKNTDGVMEVFELIKKYCKPYLND